ncbi:MAG TPA: archease [Ktedonobacteraceae bacterium]|jgi:SHS2 domain-containing protein
MTRPPYEAFDHTADVGLHAYARTLPELFSNAATGMQSLMVAPAQLRPQVSRQVSAQGHDLVSLLVAWLSEFIFLFDTEYLLFNHVEISDFTGTSIKAVARGEVYDASRHELSSAIKAVTWHEAQILPSDSGYSARVIFDI